MNEEISIDKLKFFASVTSNITHEIKNCLAIINESNGLMEDMLLMAEQGLFEPEKFQQLIQQNFIQLKKANNVLSYINWLSNSLDRHTEPIESHTFLENITASVSSITENKKIKLLVSALKEHISWEGNLFSLQFLLYLTMQHLATLCQKGGTIRLILNQHPSGRIVFNLTCEHPIASEKVHLETQALDFMVKEQGGEIQISCPEEDSLAFTLSFPKTIE